MDNVAGIKFRDRAIPDAAEAPLIFVGLSSLFMVSVNVRLFATGWAAFMVGLALSIIYLARKDLVQRLIRQPILILLPLLFPLSCVWSDEHFISFWLGSQTLLTALAAVAIAHRASPRQILLAVFVATSTVCLGSIVNGRLGASAEGSVLVGFLGSKDAMGLFAYLGAMTSVALMFDREQKFSLRAFACLMALIEIHIATSVHATTAVIALGLGLATFLATYFILARSKAARWASYFFAFLILIAALGLASEFLDLFMHTVTGQLGKDTTLTGRTVLWEKAFHLFEDSPLVGHGYRAYWVGTSNDARRMLASMSLTDGRGFNFHEQFLDILADMGILGEIALLATFAIITANIWKSAIKSPSTFAAYSVAIITVYLFRWFFETAFMPFSFDMMMFYMLGTVALGKPEIQKASGVHPALQRKKAAAA